MGAGPSIAVVGTIRDWLGSSRGWPELSANELRLSDLSCLLHEKSCPDRSHLGSVFDDHFCMRPANRSSYRSSRLERFEIQNTFFLTARSAFGLKSLPFGKVIVNCHWGVGVAFAGLNVHLTRLEEL